MQECKTVETLRKRELYSNEIIKIEVIDASICDRKINRLLLCKAKWSVFCV